MNELKDQICGGVAARGYIETLANEMDNPSSQKQESMYDFDTIDERVSISPMKTLFCKRIMDFFKKRMTGLIQPNQCFVNALVAAKWFCEKGFDVEVVEGYMVPNDYCFEYARRMGCNVYSEKYPPAQHRTDLIIC